MLCGCVTKIRLERTDWHRCQLSKSVLVGLKDGTQNMTCRSYHAWPAPGLPVYVLDVDTINPCRGQGTMRRLPRAGWLRCGCGGCAAALVALWATSKSTISSFWQWLESFEIHFGYSPSCATVMTKKSCDGCYSDISIGYFMGKLRRIPSPVHIEHQLKAWWM